MGEVIRLNEQQRSQWNEVREKAINQLRNELPKVLEPWQQAVIEKGISRLVDEKFNTASKKLEAVDKGHSYIISVTKATVISDKEKLIAEILEKDTKGIFNESMLKKLNTSDLRALKDRL